LLFASFADGGLIACNDADLCALAIMPRAMTQQPQSWGSIFRLGKSLVGPCYESSSDPEVVKERYTAARTKAVELRTAIDTSLQDVKRTALAAARTAVGFFFFLLFFFLWAMNLYFFCWPPCMFISLMKSTARSLISRWPISDLN
jgi:hypothetical protein